MNNKRKDQRREKNASPRIDHTGQSLFILGLPVWANDVLLAHPDPVEGVLFRALRTAHVVRLGRDPILPLIVESVDLVSPVAGKMEPARAFDR